MTKVPTQSVKADPFTPTVLEEVILPLLSRLIDAAGCTERGSLQRLGLEFASAPSVRSPAQMVFGIKHDAVKPLTDTPIMLLLRMIHGPDGPGPLRFRLERIPEEQRFPDTQGGTYRLALVIEEDCRAPFREVMLQYGRILQDLTELLATDPQNGEKPGKAHKRGKRAAAPSRGEPSTAIR